jgi:hypothetical protein
VKLDEEKGQNMLLGCMRKIGFQLIRIPQLAVAGGKKKGATQLCTCRKEKECNKYDLTAVVALGVFLIGSS